MSREAAERDSRGDAVMMRKLRKLEGSLGVEVLQQLLPGIPDNITISFVAPKLPWAVLCKLSTVSRGWQRAIQCRQVYDARVRSQSTQTVVVMHHDFAIDNHVNALALYAVSDNSFCHLPQFPGLDLNHGELPWGCQCISLDGKVYVLGGLFPMTGPKGARQASAAVYVLDLAGQGKWKQCASMQDPRSQFGCGVINGKIYVFGGSRETTLRGVHDFVNGCEVYDPESDAWSPTAPMRYHGVCQGVISVGEELFVYNGLFVDKPGDGTSFVEDEAAHCAEVYHPLRNQWRIVHDFREHVYDYDNLVVAGGKLHRLSEDDFIEIYDIPENSWKRSQALSLAGILDHDPFVEAEDDCIEIYDIPENSGKRSQALSLTGILDRDPFVEAELVAAVVVDDELLAVVNWSNFLHPSVIDADEGIWLLRSQGFGSQSREIVWHKIERPMPFHDSTRLCTIQL